MRRRGTPFGCASAICPPFEEGPGSGGARGKAVLGGILGLGVLFAGMQLFVRTPQKPSRASQGIWEAEHPPASVKSLLARSCEDCHSDRTRWPWYSRVAPFAWLVVRDVERGRHAMNLSEWTLSRESRKERLDGMCELAREGDMPPKRYTLVHGEARLSDDDRNLLCRWTQGVASATIHPTP